MEHKRSAVASQGPSALGRRGTVTGDIHAFAGCGNDRKAFYVKSSCTDIFRHAQNMNEAYRLFAVNFF